MLKRDLSITTPTWDARVAAEEAEVDERRRQTEMFKQEVVRQSSLLGAELPKDLVDFAANGGMTMAEGDDDSDDGDVDMFSTTAQQGISDQKEPDAADAPPAKKLPKPHKQKSVTFMAQEDDDEKPKCKRQLTGDPELNGCYERVSRQEVAAKNIIWDRGDRQPAMVDGPLKPNLRVTYRDPKTKQTHDRIATEIQEGGAVVVLDRTLGSGAYGVVSKVKCIKVEGNSRAEFGEVYALKKIRNVFRNRTDAKRILRELCILRDMRQHDCIVRVIDILVPNDMKKFRDLYVVFELIDTDMARVFCSDQNFKMLHVKYFLYQILRALLYMHSANLVHRDLKPANVLVNEDCSLRVADFGLSRCITEIPEVARGEWLAGKQLKKQLTQHMQTRWYRAPEVCLMEQRRETQFAMDIWGAGCIMGELFQMVVENQPNYRKRQALFRGSWSQKYSPRRKGVSDPSNSQIGRIIQVVGSPSPDEYDHFGAKAKDIVKAINKNGKHGEPNWAEKFPGTPAEGLDMLNQMLQFDPRKRLTVEQCLSHPFMAEVRQPVDELTLRKVAYEFEDMNIESHLVRQLIIQEIIHYHPEIEEQGLT